MLHSTMGLKTMNHNYRVRRCIAMHLHYVLRYAAFFASNSALYSWVNKHNVLINIFTPIQQFPLLTIHYIHGQSLSRGMINSLINIDQNVLIVYSRMLKFLKVRKVYLTYDSKFRRRRKELRGTFSSNTVYIYTQYVHIVNK